MSRRIKKCSIKFLIPLVLMFMLVGFATISTTLSINGDMELLSDLEDFSVYYSRALVNGVEDTSIIKSSTELDFGAALKTVGVDYVIEYDLTNASSAFDAQVSINCSASTEYFSINNEFDSDTPIGARQTRTGTMTLRKIQTVSGDEQSNTISCDIVATPVERSEEGVGEIPVPLEKYDPYKVGTEVSIGVEKFNIISSDDTTVTMLAQYNIMQHEYYEELFIQSKTEKSFPFSSSQTWTYTSGVATDLDISIHVPNINTNIVKYIDYLNSFGGLYNYEIDEGNLITLKQLIDLGCTAPIDYVPGSGGWNCNSSPYKDWLVNGQNWWTRSLKGSDSPYCVTDSGILCGSWYGNTSGPGIRPVLTISKELADILLYKYSVIGSEVDFSGEKFNIISHNGVEVTMLAQYNLDINTGLQTTQQNEISLFKNAYEFESSGSAVDNEVILGDTISPVFYTIHDYSSTLNKLSGYMISFGVDLISLKKLKDLGCTISEDYSAAFGMSCVNSPYVSWLDNGQDWWTKSFVSDSTSNFWSVAGDELSADKTYDMTSGVRPVITVNKFNLMNFGY